MEFLKIRNKNKNNNKTPMYCALPGNNFSKAILYKWCLQIYPYTYMTLLSSHFFNCVKAKKK